MAKLRLEVGLQQHGASLRTIGKELRDMDARKVTGIFKDALEPAAAPFVAAVGSSVLAIPVIPDGKQTGLRVRIAACAEQATWGTSRTVNVAVQMNPARMPSGEMSLPLMMEGTKRWRHPVYGRWLPGQPNQPPHPYFFQAADDYGRAAGDALKGALDDITRQLNG